MMNEYFTFLHLIFYCFAALAILSALVVITVKNPVRSALALVITFFAMAGVWLILRAEFLALILILVYVGAVMTLFLFVLMMLNIRTEPSHSGFVRYLPVAVLIVLVITGLILVALTPAFFAPTKLPATSLQLMNENNTAHLGDVLFTVHVYPFEIAGVLLFTAIIAAITLALRRPRRRVQLPENQVRVTPEERLKLVNMPAEKRENYL